MLKEKINKCTIENQGIDLTGIDRIRLGGFFLDHHHDRHPILL
jgi:hypothetical protein